MNRQLLLQFQNKRVKLVFDGNFVLTGYVESVEDDCIVFRTDQRTSIIRFERIMEIMLAEERMEHDR